MNKREREEFSELEELLWRAEAPASEDPNEFDPLDIDPDDFNPQDFDPDIFTPEEPEDDGFNFDFDYEEESSEVYRNFANGYGEPQERRQPQQTPQHREDPGRYYHPTYDDEPEPEEPRQMRQSKAPAKKKSAKKAKKRRGCGCGCLTWLVGIAVIAVVALCLFIQPPKSEESIGSRKSDTATILVCGTDADGMRTDTMMLLYLSGSEKRVGLLSLPRDSYTITASGNAAKLNSAYGRNGGGEKGMEVLMDYVQNIIGYRPDGYILLDFTLVPQIVDIMGGVDVEVPMDMEVDGVYLTAGYQHLSGQEVLTILRFRKGYATADLGRVEVQRTVMKACISQWLTPSHIGSAVEALSVLESASTSSLTTGNYLWMAKALVLGMGNIESNTLPGTAEYRSDVSYYILNRSEVAALIDASYNPYKVTITADDLKIAN